MKKMLWVLLAALVLGLAGGCSLMESSPATQASPGQNGGGAGQAAVGRYYDFDDIQVPAGMELDKDNSILFRVGSLKAGVLALSDRVDSESLINFFVESMAKDQWVLKSTFKYPKVALFFAKKGKTCVIHITEGTWTTKVEIWVAPTI